MSALHGIRTIADLQAEADTLRLTGREAAAYIDAEHDVDMLKLEHDPADIRPVESLAQWRRREHPRPPARRWWKRAA
jgi:dihydropteroate synthase